MPTLFTATFAAVAVTAAQDAFEITAPRAKDDEPEGCFASLKRSPP